MRFLKNFENNLSPNVDEWIKMAQLAGCEPDEDDVWAALRNCPEPPILANVYQRILLDRIKFHLLDLSSDFDVSCYVNSLDTHFYVNGESMVSLERFQKLLDAIDPNEDQDNCVN